MNGIGVMVALAVASWFLRAGFVVFVPASRMPAPARQALDHLPPAVLAALVAVDLTAVVRDGAGARETGLLLGALVVLAAVARWTKSVALVSVLALAAVAVLDLGPW